MISFLKNKPPVVPAEDFAGRVAEEAEALYRSGKMHCAEAVVTAVAHAFRPEAADLATHMAAGFGGGSGTGCICGAVSGGTMALGLVLPEDKQRVKRLTKDLHVWFTAEYGAACCMTILKTHGKVCAGLTGKVAGKVAEMLAG